MVFFDSSSVFILVEINFSRGQKQIVWLLCNWWREALTFYYSSPCFANPVQSSLYFIRCRNDHRIMFLIFCMWLEQLEWRKKSKELKHLELKVYFWPEKIADTWITLPGRDDCFFSGGGERQTRQIPKKYDKENATFSGKLSASFMLL